jgi:hypothetical protein
MTVEVAKESAEDVLRRLSEGRDERRVRALQAIHEVCTEQRARGSHDFRYTTLGRLLQAKGGPKTKSIGNSVPYQTLIAAHRELALGSAPRKPHAREEDPLLDGVRDPGQRARILDLRAQVGSLQRQVRDLQCIANATARVAVNPGAGGVAGQSAQFVGPTVNGLLSYERDALAGAINPRRLQRVGLVEDAQGRLQTTEHKDVFEVGFTTGLRKLLALVGGAAFGGSEIGGSTDPSA